MYTNKVSGEASITHNNEGTDTLGGKFTMTVNGTALEIDYNETEAVF